MKTWKDTLQYMFNSEPVSQEAFIIDRLTHNYGNCVDRTNLSVGLTDNVICTPIPDVWSNEELPLLMEATAIEIMSHHGNSKDVHLMWSGGIDSTAVFYALNDTGLPFTVVYNNSSIVEYPLLAEQLESGMFPQVKLMKVDIPFTMSQYMKDIPNIMMITGELGDQTFGSVGIFSFPEEVRHLPMSEITQQDIIPLTVFEYSKLSIETALKITDASHLSLQVWLWAINFIYKYQTVQLRTATMGFISQSHANVPNTIHFFDNKHFNSYALNNYMVNANFLKDTDYKMPLKEYIFSLNNDAQYRDTKTKVESLNTREYK